MNHCAEERLRVCGATGLHFRDTKLHVNHHSEKHIHAACPVTIASSPQLSLVTLASSGGSQNHQSIGPSSAVAGRLIWRSSARPVSRSTKNMASIPVLTPGANVRAHASAHIWWGAPRHSTAWESRRSQRALPSPSPAERRRCTVGEPVIFVVTTTAEARNTGGGWSDGRVRSSGRPSALDRGRSDLCSRHQHGSCARFSCVSALPAPGGAVRLAAACTAIQLSSDHLTAYKMSKVILVVFGKRGGISAGAWPSGKDPEPESCVTRVRFPRFEVAC